jgi:hypothetical protein
MDTQRKYQLGGAAVVFLNGLLALGTLTPVAAWANPCSPKIACGGSCGAIANCPVTAGCTPTSAQCMVQHNVCGGGSGLSPYTACYYQ